MVPGPYEHKPPPDDANFERLEPHSGTRLLYVCLHIVPPTGSSPFSCVSAHSGDFMQITLDISRRYLRVPEWALLPFTLKTILLHKAER